MISRKKRHCKGHGKWWWVLDGRVTWAVLLRHRQKNGRGIRLHGLQRAVMICGWEYQRRMALARGAYFMAWAAARRRKTKEEG
ncbi:hypothetical protein [uncultured Dialister sp.]|uniref:hypothetical protein n=1 Tax=uncultured Dialister sp. TaxID=278064 RepID=UPI00259A430F|nr:hypothetical protein [uncultured Dialister sp.]